MRTLSFLGHRILVCCLTHVQENEVDKLFRTRQGRMVCISGFFSVILGGF